MGSRSKRYLYTDGGAERWAFLVVEDGKIIHEESGVFGDAVTTTNDDTESEAIAQACAWAQERPGNYELYTDSRAVIAKITGGTNATRQPNIKRVQRIMSSINDSPLPASLVIKWRPRLSDEWLKRVDKMCE